MHSKKSNSVLYYALGGGYGHLIRAVDFLNTLGFSEDSSILVSQIPEKASENIPYTLIIPQIFGNQPQFSAKKLASAIQKILQQGNFSMLIMDTFPFGILKELAYLDLNKTALHYVARYIKPIGFKQLIQVHNPKNIEKTYIIDSLSLAQKDFIHFFSKTSAQTTLKPYQYPLNETIIAKLKDNSETKILVVHSGNLSELEVLLGYTQDFRTTLPQKSTIYVISPQKDHVPDVQRLDIFPAHIYYSLFDYVISGAGYNSVRFSKLAKKASYLLPFERRFDDQFMRAKEHSEQTKTLFQNRN